MSTNELNIHFITQQIEERYGFTGELLNALLSYSHLKKYPKGAYLKTTEIPEKYIRIISCGIGGYFTFKPSGEELCFFFALPGEVFFDTKSVADRTLTNIELKALKELTTVEILVEDFTQIIHQYVGGDELMRKSIELLFSDTMDQYLQLLTLNATQRYELFLKRYKHYALSIDDQYIASYLGIAPQSLSRLKRKLLSRNS